MWNGVMLLVAWINGWLFWTELCCLSHGSMGGCSEHRNEAGFHKVHRTAWLTEQPSASQEQLCAFELLTSAVQTANPQNYSSQLFLTPCTAGATLQACFVSQPKHTISYFSFISQNVAICPTTFSSRTDSHYWWHLGVTFSPWVVYLLYMLYFKMCVLLSVVLCVLL